MAYAERLGLIAEIERLRDSKVLCYLTGIRQNLVAQMADDAVREMFDHLLLLPSRPVKQLDIFLCSNGGSGTVPWRLISLFREFAKKVASEKGAFLVQYYGLSWPFFLPSGRRAETH